VTDWDYEEARGCTGVPVGGVGLWRKFRHSSTNRDHGCATSHCSTDNDYGTDHHGGTNNDYGTDHHGGTNNDYGTDHHGGTNNDYGTDHHGGTNHNSV
jgi:hypothetical protein